MRLEKDSSFEIRFIVRLLFSLRRYARMLREERFDIYLQLSIKVNGNLSQSSPVTDKKEMLHPRVL